MIVEVEIINITFVIKCQVFGLIFISHCYNKTSHKEVEMPTINDRETIKDYFTYLYNLSKL